MFSIYLEGIKRANVYERTEIIKISPAFFPDYSLPFTYVI